MPQKRISKSSSAKGSSAKNSSVKSSSSMDSSFFPQSSRQPPDFPLLPGPSVLSWDGSDPDLELLAASHPPQWTTATIPW
ncbi:hypothetical protein Trco_005709 [Trichoderma cornu-damae]|uniref:Uncharacterized protein n=1 Tax=Trichoderma cornu-damae TaxID=654480 RepID=A0A9P8QJX9_9HYPO|nr:hypothetical protein Trco_005709 [Trichoderma cornu-damae]